MTSSPASPQSRPRIHHRTRTIDGLEIFSREAGPDDAPVVLLLHGFPTSSRMYRDLIPQLAEHRRVLAPDLPGFGSSSLPPRGDDGWGFGQAARVIDRWLEQLGVDRFTVYLMDIGGSIGWRLALARPTQIAGIVVQNAPLYPEDGGDFGLLPTYWHEPTPANRALAQAEALSLENTRAQYEVGVADADIDLLDPDAWQLDQAQLDRPGVADVAMDYLLDISRQVETFAAARAWLRETRPPLLVASGRGDVIFPEASQRAFLDDVPDAEFHALDTGHFALATHVDEIGALIRDFLARRVDAGGSSARTGSPAPAPAEGSAA
ncbi:alpha/beta hydrolase [Schumannella luteola]|uniref:Pimeloyl-ACP methyl ester carboxylesterase n=1 Tax=Schumannella luteola TaxID=472059 RepID=A0A852YHD5_9MICO|nr:alpha/beta fold hydrolase [Schumannella luteola]NYG98478.1 pimeloyl-ACP methyl ester carboxylesterase [Schumannella luteola]TPX01296.1 alpha/beta fold hydrolase [Schumannella luteola]